MLYGVHVKINKLSTVSIVLFILAGNYPLKATNNALGNLDTIENPIHCYWILNGEF